MLRHIQFAVLVLGRQKIGQKSFCLRDQNVFVRMAAPSCGKSGERDPDVVRAVDDVVGIQVDGAVDVARSVCVERTVENLILILILMM